ncbi:transposase [Algimonas arctica]|uniref:Transposase n=1 Tax=Algimonas arctica TaxID=1479486 RepID=A0A8J3G1A2_9PROT|nr:IS66 family insertion sequence element accessory protein TnpB [Algimonas arctica]GHA85147.1 transposase [Algimonas arctica]
MIHPGYGVQIYVATKPVDFRKGYDGLAAIVQRHLKGDPFNGAVYVFRAKRADRLKLIYWDGMGLVLDYKRLEQHAFKWPAIRDGVLTLNAAQYEALFAGLDWRRVTALCARAPIAAE